jgi:NhaA family Na+:H+ antiporter
MARQKRLSSIQRIVRSLTNPFRQFIELEESSGIILLLCSVLALALANSQWQESFLHFWEEHFSLAFGTFKLEKSLEHWINDGLMAIFFLVVGLEIKREVMEGELSNLKKALLPIMAAVGGMIVPALIFAYFNRGSVTSSGWAIPMATDIAFSLAILSLLGNRVPASLKVFLAALAIVDDLGAVLVIAFFYTEEIHFIYLLGAGSIFVFLMLLNLLKFRQLGIYLIFGFLMWFCMLESGVHATIAGVLLAFTIPFRTRPASRHQLLLVLDKRLEIIRKEIKYNDEIRPRDISEELEEISFQMSSPAQQLEHNLHSYVAYLIMPVFALANAGVVIDATILNHVWQPVSAGVVLGLMLGKPVGIALLSWLSVRLRLASLPQGVSWRHIIGVGFLGGIGFTMSVFITLLAFSDTSLHSLSKLSIVVASLASGTIGYFFLRFFTPNQAISQSDVELPVPRPATQD